MAQNIETGEPVSRITDWLKEAYICYETVDEVGANIMDGGFFFKLGGLKFNTPYAPEFAPGDRVKITIQKEEANGRT